MKCYLIDPPFDMYGTNDSRTPAAIELIAKMVFDCLRSGGDNFQYVVDWRDPGAPADAAMFHEHIVEPDIIQLQSDQDLLDRLRASVDPNFPIGGTVRSIATCRAVTFGYDGQAFLCLRLEDKAPVSPDTSLATIEERPEILVDYDYFDGWTRDQT